MGKQKTFAIRHVFFFLFNFNPLFFFVVVVIQSAFHDGKQANWFHSVCFFKKQKPNSTGDILNFEKLKYEDQKFIEEELGKFFY